MQQGDFQHQNPGNEARGAPHSEQRPPGEGAEEGGAVQDRLERAGDAHQEQPALRKPPIRLQLLAGVPQVQRGRRQVVGKSGARPGPA